MRFAISGSACIDSAIAASAVSCVLNNIIQCIHVHSKSGAFGAPVLIPAKRGVGVEGLDLPRRVAEAERMLDRRAGLIAVAYRGRRSDIEADVTMRLSVRLYGRAPDHNIAVQRVVGPVPAGATLLELVFDESSDGSMLGA